VEPNENGAGEGVWAGVGPVTESCGTPGCACGWAGAVDVEPKLNLGISSISHATCSLPSECHLVYLLSVRCIRYNVESTMLYIDVTDLLLVCYFILPYIMSIHPLTPDTT
jgi:hypothetical protein